MPFPKEIAENIIAAFKYLQEKQLTGDAEQLANFSPIFNDSKWKLWPLVAITELQEQQTNNHTLKPFYDFLSSTFKIIRQKFQPLPNMKADKIISARAKSTIAIMRIALFIAYKNLPPEKQDRNLYQSMHNSFDQTGHAAIQELEKELGLKIAEDKIPVDQKKVKKETIELTELTRKSNAISPLTDNLENNVKNALDYLEENQLNNDPKKLADFYETYYQLVIGGHQAGKTLQTQKNLKPFFDFMNQVTVIRKNSSDPDSKETITTERLPIIRLALLTAYAKIPRKQQSDELYQRMYGGADKVDYAVIKKFYPQFIAPTDLEENLPPVKSSKVAGVTDEKLQLSGPLQEWDNYIDEIITIEQQQLGDVSSDIVASGTFNEISFSSTDVVLQGSETPLQVAINEPKEQKDESKHDAQYRITQNEKALKLLGYHDLQHSARLATPLMYDVTGARIAERAGKGSLEDALKSASPLKIISYIDQAIDGISLLHENWIAHRDIKPDNMLVGNDDRLLISDLDTLRPVTQEGHARAINSETGEPGNESVPACIYTPDYAAPEIYKKNEKGEIIAGYKGNPHLLAIDVYALGRSIFEMLGRLPAPSNNAEKEMLQQLSILASHMTQEDPTHRPTMAAVKVQFQQIVSQAKGKAYFDALHHKYSDRLERFSKDDDQGYYLPMRTKGNVFNVSSVQAITVKLKTAQNMLYALQDDGNWKSADNKLRAAQSTVRVLDDLSRTITERIKKMQDDLNTLTPAINKIKEMTDKERENPEIIKIVSTWHYLTGLSEKLSEMNGSIGGQKEALATKIPSIEVEAGAEKIKDQQANEQARVIRANGKHEAVAERDKAVAARRQQIAYLTEVSAQCYKEKNLAKEEHLPFVLGALLKVDAKQLQNVLIQANQTKQAHSFALFRKKPTELDSVIRLLAEQEKNVPAIVESLKRLIHTTGGQQFKEELGKQAASCLQACVKQQMAYLNVSPEPSPEPEVNRKPPLPPTPRV